MIKKLRRRLVLITMSLVSLVLIATFAILLISSSNRMESDSFRSLTEGYSRLAEVERENGIKPPPEKVTSLKQDRPFDGQSHFSTFYITLNDSDEAVKIDDFSRDLSAEVTEEALSLALEEGDLEGVIHDLNLRYKVFDDGIKRVVGFIDISFEVEFIQQQMIYYSLIGAGSLLAFFLISLMLSKIAIKPVEQAWKQQQQFVADASHELKTPITVMLANTSILLSDKAPDKEGNRKWITYIDLEAKRMKKLVEDLLFLARVDAAEETIHHRLSLTNAVSEITLPFEAVVFESGKNLYSDIEDQVEIVGDMGQIKQLISILLDNAGKYAYDGSTISVTLNKSGNRAQLQVHTLSEVIEAEHIKHIFDRFYRVDKARTREKNSYGLGLAIAKEIVTAHKGEISVNSDEQGTTFKVIFPIA